MDDLPSIRGDMTEGPLGRQNCSLFSSHKLIHTKKDNITFIFWPLWPKRDDIMHNKLILTQDWQEWLRQQRQNRQTELVCYFKSTVDWNIIQIQREIQFLISIPSKILLYTKTIFLAIKVVFGVKINIEYSAEEVYSHENYRQN